MSRIHPPRRPSRGAAPFGALLAATLLAAPAAPAQDASAPAAPASGAAPLRITELYRAVDAASPRLAAARAQADAARARVPSAGLPPDPQLQLGFMNYALPELRPMDPTGMVQLQAMQMLPLGGKLRLGREVADARADAAAARVEEAAWEARSRAAMAFYDLWQTDRSLEVARETLRLLADIARTAESMYRVGEGRQADVLRARVEIARMAEDTVRMRAMRVAMAARLNAQLDRDPSAPVGEPALPAFPAALPAADSAGAAALLTRPMLRAGEEELRAASGSARLAARELLPDLQLGVQYAQRSSAMGTERMGSLMVGASLPVFARSRQLRMREEAAAMRQMAAADLRAMRAETRARVAEVLADLTRARDLAALYRATILPQARAAAASSRAAYRVGSVDFMTLLDDEMTVNRYRTQLLALDAEQGKAWAELEMITGRALVSDEAALAAGGDR